MKKFYLIILASVLLNTAQAQVIFSEIHYDNSGADINERIEILGPVGTDLSGWSVELYVLTSTDAELYATIPLSGTIPDLCTMGAFNHGVIVFNHPGINNGPFAGMALIDNLNNVVEFLSYEGVISAVDGHAAGMTSVNIPVFENGSGTSDGSIIRNSTGNSWTTNPATNSFDACNSSFIFLPAHFGNVKAYQQGSGIRIDWSNLTENDVANYQVERSANGQSFSSLTTINASVNNGSRADYSYFDAVPVSGINFYRIRYFELSGKILYSTVIKVNTKGGAIGIVTYPNPVTDGQLSLQTTGLNKGQYMLRVFDAAGQQVHKQLLNLYDGAATEVIQLPLTLKPGMYNLQLSGGEVKLAKSFIIK